MVSPAAVLIVPSFKTLPVVAVMLAPLMMPPAWLVTFVCAVTVPVMVPALVMVAEVPLKTPRAAAVPVVVALIKPPMLLVMLAEDPA